jgi:hypothetical protein
LTSLFYYYYSSIHGIILNDRNESTYAYINSHMSQAKCTRSSSQSLLVFFLQEFKRVVVMVAAIHHHHQQPLPSRFVPFGHFKSWLQKMNGWTLLHLSYD